MTAGIATTLAALLLLSSPHQIAHVEGNLLDCQNVLNSRVATTASSAASRRRSRASPASRNAINSSSPLRRSDSDVFGLQQKSISNRRGGNGSDNQDQTSILQTSSTISSSSKAKANDDETIDEDGTHNKQLNIHPPNIKIQPRKNELWLPWPLGELRSDFNRFADEHHNSNANGNGNGNSNNNNNARQEWHPRGSSSQQQQQIKRYYSDDSEEYGILEQSKDWAGRMLRKGGNMLPFSKFHDNSDSEEDSMPTESSQSQSTSKYWIKDTTTPMATASATMGKNRKQGSVVGDGGGIGKSNKQKMKKQSSNGVIRGGDEAIEEDDKSGLDKAVLFQYLKLQASVRLRQLGYVGSDVSVHLPPVAPILLFYYFYPSKQDPIRRLVKYTVSGAALSWMHSEATKYRRFSPLPSMRGVNVRAPNLPPFLPEEWHGEEGEPNLSNVAGAGSAVKTGSASSIGIKGKAASIKATGSEPAKDELEESSDNHHHWDPFQSFGTISSAYRKWLEGYNLRTTQSYLQRRTRAQDHLLEMKKSSTNSTSTPSKPNASSATSTNGDTGYALVTGASSGIGRALAVELARYKIPLILVARDLTKLTAVAKDIETYYGIPCRVLQADLSEVDCAKRIHAATSAAGLNVDILVNNAGVCSHGHLIDGEDAMDDVNRMISVNIGAVTQLSRLYGKDMKQRRRGRILIVSSMAGALPGCPSVAVYAATKAFGKSLSMSLGREMERYGVGVTCLLPGAVKDTSFASRSEVEDAACFHFPGYAKTPEIVAGEGVQGLMLGYPEIHPGAINRAFVKMFLPMLPTRVSNILGEWAWNPWQWGDVMPQRPGSIGRIKGESRLAEIQQQDDNSSNTASSSLPTPDGPSTTSSAPALNWNFLRSSSPLRQEPNQMQFPGIAEPNTLDSPNDVTSKPTSTTMKILVDTTELKVSPADPQNNTAVILEDSEFTSSGTKSDEVSESIASSSALTTIGALGKANESIQLAIDSNTDQKNDKIPKPQFGNDIRSSQSDGESKVKGGKDLAVSQDVVPTPKALVLPPAPAPIPKNDSQASSPLALFGFFEKDTQSSSKSSGEESAHHDNDAKDRDGITGEGEDKVDCDPLSPPSEENEETWYPSMMDKKDYDFRDRRLDY